MRPCDQCGGSGMIATGTVGMVAVTRQQCVRCVDMPKLIPDRELFPGGFTYETWTESVLRGEFKPDPDTIEWRCEFLQLYWPASDHTSGNRRGLSYNCEVEPSMHSECGWVERPTRLEVIHDI